MYSILHVSSSAVVFACENEKNERHREKVVYDVNAKALAKAFRYQPFGVTSVWQDSGRVVVSASKWHATRRRLPISLDWRSAVPWHRRGRDDRARRRDFARHV
jgi:hypothetical protein